MLTYVRISICTSEGAAPPGWRRVIEQAPIAGAAAGLFGGVGAAMSSAVFTGASWFVANEGARRWLSTACAILIFLTIPLLIIGGFCMDWLEKNNPKRDPKAARYEDDEEER
ncbi:MAG TPA: hypothetical protein VFY40_25860 [Blastocatellia bacterium]|nr:hypothetical protein [Blastocatellia bacterium]